MNLAVVAHTADKPVFLRSRRSLRNKQRKNIIAQNQIKESQGIIFAQKVKQWNLQPLHSNQKKRSLKNITAQKSNKGDVSHFEKINKRKYETVFKNKKRDNLCSIES